MTDKLKLQPSGPLTQRLFNAYQQFRLQVTGGNRMKDLALTSAFRMLAGAGVLPSTFDASEFTEARVEGLLTTGVEVLRMIKAGDPNSEDAEARDIYRTYFAASTTPN